MKKIHGLHHDDGEHSLRSGVTARGRGRRILRVCACILAGWLLLSAPPRGYAQRDETAEYPVKLAFLYHITKFVEWPADAFPAPGAPLVICIVGLDPFHSDLEEELRKRTVGGRPIELKRVKPSDHLSACHVAFVSAAEEKKAIEIATRLRGSGTLTVSETDGFAKRGGIINLIVEDNNLRFEINLGAAKQNRLTISSKVLALARIINSPPAP